jgi:preprotein translocase subunit YajC
MPCPLRTAFESILTPVAVFAQAAAPAGQKQPDVPFFVQYLPLIAIAVTAYLLLFRPERERMRRQQELLGTLKKNDRVVTSSGIYGTVANVEREADRVTLKVDDAANVKITVTLSSIARVLRDGQTADGGADAAGGA